MNKDIVIKGAKVNNLKSLDISIPKNQLVVVTGVSGSGKTSLVIDTLYAEGQRRYVESLSSYARQFMGRMKKPEVEYIKGLCPAIALEQKTAGGNARSTVGSMTEIYDFLRLLYARVGVTISPISGNEVKRDAVSDILDFIKEQKEGDKIFIYAPLHLNYSDRTLETELDIYEKKGYSRVVVDNDVLEIDEFLKSKDKRLAQTLGQFAQDEFLILIDRLKAKNTEDNLNRAQDSIQTAYAESGGTCIVQVEDQRYTFNNRFELDGLTFLEPNPGLFNYNNPYGACEECEGFGRVMGIDENKVVPDPTLSLYEGAIACWNGQKLSQWTDNVIAHADESGFPIHKPYKDLTPAERKLLWNGNAYFDGIRDFFKELEGAKYKIQNRILLARYRGRSICPSCNGNRLREEAEYVKVSGKSITELINIPLSELAEFFVSIQLTEYQRKIAKNILKEIETRLENLIDLGLPYLHLDRLASTLSGGEAQRINLTKCIGSNLTSSMYILDEPSIGLHPRDTSRLVEVLQKLKNLGNSVIVVEHEEDVIRAADHIIDIGPRAGRLGGELVFNGKPEDLVHSDSLTGEYLRNIRVIEVPTERRKPNYGLHVIGPYMNNLKGDDVTFKFKAINVVSGVSGSGKTTLVRDILLPNIENVIRELGRTNIGCREIKIDKKLFDNIEYVGQQSIGRSSRSNPITYVKAYDAIRKLYTSQNLAKIRGYTPKHFSFNVDGGRCETCKGDGEIQIEMQFLADVKLTCEDCKGQRFKKEILEVKYRGKNIYELLEMNLDESMAFFEGNRDVLEKLQPLLDVGLGYLKLGQPTSTLSGGEAQRLKLASYLASKNSGDRYIFIFDEPTTGLHFHDINKLLDAFNALVDAGHTLVIIEHNLEIIKNADWLIDLGPEGGKEGGQLLGMGTPEQISELESSYTAKYLKENYLMLQVRALNIYHREDFPDNPKGYLILIHGFAEHSGRYDHLVEALNRAGIGVGRFDLPGHGRTDLIDGKKAYFLDFDVLLETVETYFRYFTQKIGAGKIFVFGHSLGGLTAAHFTLKHQNALAGMILSAPALKVSHKISPFLQKLSGFVSKFLPDVLTIALDEKGISRDPKVLESYNTDPLNYRGKIRAITGHEILEATKDIGQKLDEFQLPFFVMHGTQDILTDPKGSQALYNRAPSDDKYLKLYEGLYHELINEPEKEEVIHDIVNWLTERVS